MKITELAIREAEPNYEANPAQARLSAIAVKLMDKSKETSDINLGIALSKVANELTDYGSAFGAKNMQELLDRVNGEGRYAPDADMPQDNKNPIKVTKESLMKMMAYGQKMVDKEGTVKVDIDEDMNSVMAKAGKDKHGDTYMKKAREMAQKKGRKLTPAERDSLRNKHSKNRKEVKEDDERDIARQTQNQIRIIIKEIAKLNEKINELSDMDNGDLTDQLSTMFKHIQGLYAVASRAQKIVPIYEAIPTSEYDYDLMKFYKKVQELEDQNQHGEVADMLVHLYGNNPESLVIRGINGLHAKQGSITRTQQMLRDEISNKYYYKLEKEIEELKKTSPAYTMTRESSFGDRSMAARQMKADRIAKDVDKGMSMDAIVGKYANKGTTNTDEIRKMVRDYKFKSRMKK